MNKQIRELKERVHNFIYYRQMDLSSYKFPNEFNSEAYPNTIISKSEIMINQNTGFPIEYQENKVFNLKLASKKINHLVIKPGETFSFWHALKDVEKETPYKDGLCTIKGEMHFVRGGGLCQLSNILFYLFLNGPFKIVERHGHDVREFNDPNALFKGIDATVAEGYLDLKVKNIADYPIRIDIEFDDESIIGSLKCENAINESYQIINKNLAYQLINYEQFEIVDVYRQRFEEGTLIEEEKLYTNVVKILCEI